MDNDILNYFLKLVSIDSESLDERAMMDALKKDLQAMGASEIYEDNAHHQTGGNAGNLYAFFPGNIKKEPILLCAHVDTVKPGKGIKPIVKDGVIYSDGTTVLGGDDKSGVAEIICGLKKVIDSGEDYAPVEVLFTISEEIGLLGAKHFEMSKLKSSFGYAFDAHTVGELTVGAPSQKSFKIIVRGREAHAGVEPEKGLNAIRIASEIIAALPLGRIDYETTSNVGVIKGGEATNIVPNKVVVEGEMRSHDRDKLEALCNRLHEASDKAAEPYLQKGGSVDFIANMEYHAFRIDSEAPVVKLAKRALENIGVPVSIIRGGGGSDANIFNQAGLPMIIVGSGMEKVHTVQECLKISELHRGADFVQELIKQHSQG